MDTSGSVDSAVRRTVEEFITIGEAMDELRETLRAHGVPLRITAMLVNFGLQKQPERQAEAMDSALAQAARVHGGGVLTREFIADRVADIVRLQQELNAARASARGAGFDPESLTVLAELIQRHPGDRGEKAVNTFLAYARACGIALDGVPTMAAALCAPPPSALPRLSRERTVGRSVGSLGTLLRDLVIGLAIGTLVIGLLT